MKLRENRRGKTIKDEGIVGSKGELFLKGEDQGVSLGGKTIK